MSITLYVFKVITVAFVVSTLQKQNISGSSSLQKAEKMLMTMPALDSPERREFVEDVAISLSSFHVIFSEVLGSTQEMLNDVKNDPIWYV